MDDFNTTQDFLLQDRQTAGLIEAEDSILAQLGCIIAVNPGSIHMQRTLKAAITSGMSYEFLIAVLVHAIGYVGILDTQTAYEILQELWTANGTSLPKLTATTIPTDRQERVTLGTKLYSQFDPERAKAQGKKFAIISDAYYPRALEISGLTLRSPIIPLRQRQIITVAMLASKGIEPQLKFHLGVAQQKGVTQKQLAGILLFVQVYAGMPRANSAALLMREVLLEA